MIRGDIVLEAAPNAEQVFSVNGNSRDVVYPSLQRLKGRITERVAQRHLLGGRFLDSRVYGDRVAFAPMLLRLLW